jgi:predicted permease
MRTLLWDLRYAIRQTARNRGFALAAVISLALGIGAATAVFSVIYAALINPYPYRDADRILRLALKTKTQEPQVINLNASQLQALKQSPAIEDTIAMGWSSLPLTSGDFPEDVETIFLSSNGFDFLGKPVLLGRGIMPSDASAGKEPNPVVVLSYKFWLRHFFGDPSVIGKTLELNRTPYRIIGVAQPRFTWYSGDVYLPLKLATDANHQPLSYDSPSIGAPHSYMVDLRLKPGLTPQQGSAALLPLLEQFAHDRPGQFPPNFEVALEGLNAWVLRGIGPTLYLLLGAVALLLVIGCGNVSILLLARGTARAHEFAVRSAIGAARIRIIRQLLTESLLLAITGAALGIALAYGSVTAMKVLLPQYEFAPEVVVNINVPVLCVCVSIALVTGLLFGLSPALQLSRAEPERILQSGKRSMAGTRRGRRTHEFLIAGQIALTLLLLAGAGAAIKGFLHLLHVPLGYDPHNVISVWIPLPENTYPAWTDRLAYFEKLLTAVREVPGVTATAISTNATPPDSGYRAHFEILGKPTSAEQEIRVELISPEYFSTLEIPTVQGRVWTNAENRTGAHLAVINQALARQYFPNGDAIGQSIKLPQTHDDSGSTGPSPGLMNTPLQIAGVVADSRNSGLRDPVAPAVYVPYSLSMPAGTQILVRSSSNPLRLLNAIRHALAQVNPNQQAARVVSDLDKWISDQPEWQQEHLVAWLFGAFAVLALSLAAVGLYSVVSYAVAQRTNEFGIRMALGAQRSHVLRIVFASMLACVSAGVLTGALLTWVLKSLLATWVGADAHDPILLPLGALVLTAVAALACYIPARRASRVNPIAALRAE